jgi:transcriptional regulator with XRE-family HTH domain
MSQTTTFGDWLKTRRIAKKQTLRAFAHRAGIDPGNLSRYERGVLAPPQDAVVLERIGNALEIRKNTEEWREMVSLAAVGGGRIPPDITGDPDLLNALPILFRAIKGKKLTREDLIRLAKKIQES